MIFDKCKNKEGKIEYSLTPESKLSELAKGNSKISIYGGRNAIIGCSYGEWCLRTEPSKEDTVNVVLYFDEDGPTDSEELNKEFIGTEKWTGNGEFILPDFYKLVNFLNEMISDNEIKKFGANVKK